MGTVLTMLAGAKRIIANSIRWRISSFEHSLSYDRKDGKRVEMALSHYADISGEGRRAPLLQLASRKIVRNPNCTPNEYIGLSMEEARLLRDFLNRPEIVAYLEEEGA